MQCKVQFKIRRRGGVTCRSGAGADQPTDTDDELPELIASDSESEEDEHSSESSEERSDNSDETDVVVTAQPLVD